MQTEIVIAGFGGQGVLFAGQLLAYAAMDSGMETTWIPSYGPEMRGGTANCTVIVADEEIGAPVVRNPQAVIAMNRPSLDKYEPLIKPGGVLVVNSSMVDRTPERDDIIVVTIPGNEIAEELGSRRLTNMVLLGGLLKALPVLPLEAIEKALAEHLPERHKKLLPQNYQALRAGANYEQEAFV
ncbi:MAG TPA: 2-oxoacid:ferredoxin oxidoreductase subunit gamma [Chloroflexi bacterium]|jgi:2-oxoglutarate ferredoxin oxidoreductase subunit gamma|nr:2-oxoacid:ferredoxin oxidoreductase subunit gamma [Chloroflexota bacterium]HPO57999.1 2-oxoacid:acceptor oxidoreductase family protein [Anaerolineaceae bacterium]